MKGNWSYSTAFYPGESRFSDIFAARVEQAMGLTPINGGKFQITSYPEGKGKYPYYKRTTNGLYFGLLGSVSVKVKISQKWVKN